MRRRGSGGFEKKHHPVAPLRVYLKRLARFMLMALGVIAAALSLGVAGYHWIAGFSWIDALLNASMILGGMGPVDTLAGDGAKLFASAYALFSGLVVLATMGIILTPVMHRVLHKFHVEDGGKKE